MIDLPSLQLKTTALYILYLLKKNGFVAYLVGGAVRDLLADGLNIYEKKKEVSVTDYDFTTNAKPEEILIVFSNSFYENNFGTVSVTPKHLMQQMQTNNLRLEDKEEDIERANKNKIDVDNASKVHDSLSLPHHPVQKVGDHNYEITTFRSGEVYGEDVRHPSSFNWGENLFEDLARRDFTINGLALDIDFNFLETIFTSENILPNSINVDNFNYKLIDEFTGVEDLQQNLIRTIGDPQARFVEDALRMLRAIRFSVQLNFAIEEYTYKAIVENATLIKKISWERIRDELLKILSSDFPKEGLLLLDETGLLDYILPELVNTKGVMQSGHHVNDVWTHSLDSVASSPSDDPIVRLATLLHDIGKANTQGGKTGNYTFYNHEVVGARMAKVIARRLNLSTVDTNRIFILVRHHMFYYQPENTDAAIRRFMRKVGLENLNDILDVREADRLGSNARKTSWRLEEMKERMTGQLHQPMEVRDLAVNGHDLMLVFDLKPGPILGEIGNYLLELVLDDASLNEKTKLLEKTREYLEERAEG